MKHYIKYQIFVWLLLLGVLHHRGNAQSITLEVKNVEQIKNKSTGNIEPTAFVGESFVLQATLHNIDKNVHDLSIAGLNSFNVAGAMRSSNVIFINGQQSIEHVHKYTLIPHNEGSFTIGPATVQGKRGKHEITSNTLTINVIKRPAGYQSQNRKTAPDNNVEVFCELKPGKNRVVVGEPLEVIASIYTRGPILQVGIEAPTFNNFLLKEIAQAKTHQETRDGKTYDVTDKKLILTPLQAGEKRIDPILIRYAIRIARHKARDFFDHTFFDDFFAPRVEQRTAFSNELVIRVDPLPPHKGKVNGVGEFSALHASISKTEAQANEALVYKLTVQGKGNFDQVTAPSLILPSGFKHYESKNFVEEDLSQDFIPGKKTFEYVIQIPKAGDCEIPAQSFTFYDTTLQSYKTLQSKPIMIAITPSGASESTTQLLTHEPEQDSEKEAPQTHQAHEQDVHFIQEDVRATYREAPALPLWIFLLLLLTPALILSSSTLPFFRKWYYRIFRVSGKRRLDEFEHKLDGLIKRDSTQGLYQLLLAFLAVKFDVPESTITHDWIVQKLYDDGIPSEKIQEFMDYLNECASLHFVTQPKSLAEQRNILKRGKYWIIFLGK